MKNLLKNWRILLLICLLVFSFLTITFKGIQLGVDFKGGTLFQIHLAEKVEDPNQMSSVKSTIQQRLDWTGLKDTKVSTWGDEFVIAQIAETNPEKVEKLETLLLKQGKFESLLDGNVIFDGSEILQISKNPGEGYGFQSQGDKVMWVLPFVLSNKAAKRFSQMSFHRCTLTSYDPQQGKQYDCDKTYFFIDRPIGSVLIIPYYVYEQDRALLASGNLTENIPAGTDIDELLLNTGLNYVLLDENGLLSEQQKTDLQALLQENSTVLIPPSLNENLKQELVDLGYRLLEQAPLSEEYSLMPNEEGTQNILPGSTIPWVWQVSGAKQVISLSEDVTNLEPYVASIEDAKTFDRLMIRGFDRKMEEAEESLRNLTILLESGSLPVPVDNISKETISSFLGEEFLQSTFFIGLVALIVVSLVIFIRYRNFKLAVPILFTGLSEVYLILGFAALISWRLDLAAVAGILAAVGTGVDNQIIITDELIGRKKEEETSLLNRVKKAFFIIAATASTTIATMLPVILLGFGFGKLVGFAITTISGVLLGVLVTRPAYGEIAKYILESEKREK